MMHLSLLQLAVSRSDTKLLALDLPAPWLIRPWNEGKYADLSCKTCLRFTAEKHQVQIRQNI